MAGRGVASIAADHVRLCYHYLDTGDVDGYCSLFEEDAILECPGSWPIRGRRAMERAERRRQAVVSRRHSMARLAVVGELVLVGGRVEWRRRPDGDQVLLFDFVDLFVVCQEGLISRRRTLALITVGGF
jgi:ketosteroid isomerase-like protein